MFEAVVVLRARKEDANALDPASVLTVQRLVTLFLETRFQIRKSLGSTDIRAAAGRNASLVGRMRRAGTFLAAVRP